VPPRRGPSIRASAQWAAGPRVRGRARRNSSRFAPSLRARRAGTSRVRSVRGSRRARRAAKAVGGFRARRARRSGSRRRANPGRAAPAARPWLLSRASFGATSASFCARRRSSAARSQACPAPLTQANRMRVVSRAVAVGRRAPARGREQRRGEQRQRERPVQFFGRERNRRARPRGSSLSPAPARPAAGVSARRARSWARAAANGAGR